MNLAAHYSRFRVSERILLTGHSHQAWPDVAFDAQQRAWLDAAELVDDKWQRAGEVALEVCDGWRRLLKEPAADLALGQNTHELVVRWLSAVITGRRQTVITTDGEFHTIRRQLDRLAEAGVPVIKVAARPVATLAERLAAAVDDRAAGLLVSSVLYETAEIVPHLSALAERCARYGVELLIDAYHHLNIVPFDVRALGLERAFITGGGYKYCQMGEGNCFLRLPPDCALRPVVTGWFGEFSELAEAKSSGEVRYGTGGARFAGATYDPTPHYRAAAVFAFFQRQQLTPERLRAINLDQVVRLERALRAEDLAPDLAAVVDIPAEHRAGFLAIKSPHAAALVRDLRLDDVYVDARGEMLRLGPAPYLSNEQLEIAASLLIDRLNRLQNPRV